MRGMLRDLSQKRKKKYKPLDKGLLKFSKVEKHLKCLCYST